MIKNLIAIFLLVIGLIILPGAILAQDKYDDLDKQLEELSEEIPALNERINISVGEVSVQEFLRAVANNSKLNLNIDPALNFNVTNNFSQVLVKDMLIFLAREYNLDISVIGNIITISKTKVKAESKQRKLDITYDNMKDYLSVSLKNDTLSLVAQEITRKSKKNVILSSGIGGQLVSAFIQDMPFDNVMEKFAYANNLEVEKTKDGFYLISPKQQVNTNIKNNQTVNQINSSSKSGNRTEYFLEAINADSIKISAINTPIMDIISDITEVLKINYFLVSGIEGTASLNISCASFDELMEYLFDGTEYTFKKQKNIYIFGERKQQELLSFKVIQLQYRTVDMISELIPGELTKDIEIKEFPDLNSLLVTGPITGIQDIEDFVREIDKIVPVVMIEVLIVDVTKRQSMSIGIDAGLGNAPENTSGSLYPSLNMQLNSNTINDLLTSFNGFGLVNLGQVTPDFYVNIKALEDNGVLRLRSTPKLSTLNGHEATLSIGKTEYYLEEQNNLIGTQNPQSVTTRKYQSVNADLLITIKPLVSGDEQITLDIQVQQSDFTARMSPDAPPGQVTRNFQSLIRIKNQEMILLGGLEEKSSSNTGSGVPFLSRIPVIKWIFSSRTQAKSDTKLNIFIKPTVIY